MRTFAVEFGLCGFGASSGQVPELRLGVVRLWCCRGSIREQLRELRCSLADAVRELRNHG